MGTGISQIKNLQLSEIRISRIQEIAPDVFILAFQRPWNFIAGQVIGITLTPKLEPRLYSIASGEQEDEVEILFDVKKDGRLTPGLSLLNEGDMLLISAPFGEFTKVVPNSWWIATGTGIAPFRSMMKSGKGSGNRLLQGGRQADSFYFSDEFSSFLGSNYLHCSSILHENQFYSGRLSTWLREQESLNPEEHFFLCGSAEMVVSVRDILIAKGIPFSQIHAEIYF